MVDERNKRTTFPLSDDLFKAACAAYTRFGGTEQPDKELSHEEVGGGGRYVVLRNANGVLITLRNKFTVTQKHSDGSDHSELNRHLVIAEWPEPEYSLDPRDHIHALGAISANYSLLERMLQTFFVIYTKLPRRTSVNLFGKLSNELRINTIRDALTDSGHPTEVQTAVEWFLTGFMTIFHARNILLHASLLSQPIYLGINNPLEIPIRLEKSPKKNATTSNVYEPSLQQLREIADDAKSFTTYASDLCTFIMQNYEKDQLNKLLAEVVDESSRSIIRKIFEERGKSLPDRPPQPTPLTPRFP